MIQHFFVFASIVATAAAADGVCLNPLGSEQPIKGATCVEFKCLQYRNSTCLDAVCKCAPGQCTMNPKGDEDGGECVDYGRCSKNTGGGCNFFACDKSRKATCAEAKIAGDSKCVCAADECAVQGVCVKIPTVCGTDTGGTCRIFGCDASRKAVCTKVGGHHWKCMCKEGECAAKGSCVPSAVCAFPGACAPTPVSSLAEHEVVNLVQSGPAAFAFVFLAVAFVLLAYRVHRTLTSRASESLYAPLAA